MNATTIPLGFSPIHRLQAERTESILKILQPSVVPAEPPTSLSYACVHHALEGAEIAARAKNTALFTWYQEHPDAAGPEKTTTSPAGPSIILDLDQDQLRTSPISETPYHLLGPDTVKSPEGLRSIAVSARKHASDTGFGDLLADHATVTCLLTQRSLGQTLNSWTISRLPGTVFCDHVGDAVVLARDLIHEAGHNWLNDALNATGCRIGDSETFYSPWKQSRRPAFGFLHACWAFPLTVIYVNRVIDTCGGEVRDYLTAYLNKQRDFLADTAADHRRALCLVEDQELAAHLHEVHAMALAL